MMSTPFRRPPIGWTPYRATIGGRSKSPRLDLANGTRVAFKLAVLQYNRSLLLRALGHHVRGRLVQLRAGA